MTIRTLTRYVILLAVLSFAAPAAAQSDGEAIFSPVTWERLLNAADAPHNWLMYNGTLDRQLFRGMDQINRETVTRLT